MIKKIIFSIIVLAFLACKKDDLDKTPEIKFESISPTEVTESQDGINIVIWYRDNDGDLGENNPDVKNLFVKDLRNNVTYEYRIQQLSPNDEEIRIQGTLNVQLGSQIIVDGENQVAFEVHVVDQAGNISNKVTTEAVTIKE